MFVSGVITLFGALLACAALLAAWPGFRGGVDSLLAWLDERLERRTRGKAREAPFAVLLLSPAMLVLGVFGIAPLFYAVYMSLFRWRGISATFEGFGNYREALASPAFWHALAVTVYYALGTIPISMIASFFIASGLSRLVRARGVLRTIYFLPYITSIVAAATVWRTILHPHFGLINTLLGLAGVPREAWPAWLLEPRGLLSLLTGGLVPETIGPSLALVCIMIFEIWHSSGFMIVIFLAGLTAIPRELEDAARIDGASWLQCARRITVPLLSPTILFLLVVSVVRAFQAFNAFYALTGTGRGPLDSTQNLTVYIYSNFYEYQRYGYGAAVATLLAAALVTLTLLQWRILARRVHYE